MGTAANDSDTPLPKPADDSPPAGKIAITSSDGQIRLTDWDGHKPTELRTGFALRSLGYGPHGKRLAVAGALTSEGSEGGIAVFDLETGKSVWMQLGEIEPVRDITFNHSGELLYTTGHPHGGPYGLLIWRASDGLPLGGFKERSPSELRGVALLPTQPRLATSDDAGKVQLWQLPEGTVIGTALRSFPPGTAPNRRSALCPAFSPDGKYLACSYEDGRVLLFDAKTLQELWKDENEPPHDDWATSVAFSPDSSQFLSTSDDDTIVL